MTSSRSSLTSMPFHRDSAAFRSGNPFVHLRGSDDVDDTENALVCMTAFDVSRKV